MHKYLPAAWALLLLLAPLAGTAQPEDRTEQATPPADKITSVPIGYLKQEVKKVIPLSRLNVEPEDAGIAGAEIALKDNNTTGRFTKQQFVLDVQRVSIDGDAVKALETLVESGHHFVLVDAPAATLLQLADAVEGKDVLLFNVRATDENLRQEDCRANVLHTAPDRAMMADALLHKLSRRLPVGAEVTSAGAHFRVWAPRRTKVEVVLADDANCATELRSEGNGYFSGACAEARAGTRYWFRLDGNETFPDPGSRFQPDGPHGTSQVIDPRTFRWTDAEWDLPDGRTLVLEVDGSFHLDVLQAGEDAKRSRRITSWRRVVVRCTAYELTHEPHEVAADLIALGLSSRVPHDAP